jgi:hypothetical protein
MYRQPDFYNKKNPVSHTAEFFYILLIKALGFFSGCGFVLLQFYYFLRNDI